MKNIIHERLIDTFSPTHLQVLDESDHHIGHAGYEAGGRHFAIIISSPILSNLSKIAAHRKIYALLADLMPFPIHALRIEIK